MGLSRLAALHGVATSYSPSAEVTVTVPDDTVVAVLGALGVDATTPEAVRESLAAAESAARSRLLPPTLVVWTGEPLPAPLTALPPGTTLEIALEDPAQAPPPRMRVPVDRPDPAVSPWGAAGRTDPADTEGTGRPRSRLVGRAAARGAPAGRTGARRPDGDRHARRRPAPGTPPARPRPRLPRPALLPALRPLLGHGRPRGPRRPRRLVRAHPRRRIRPGQPAARRRARPPHRPVPVPPLLAPLPRPRASAHRVHSRVRARAGPGHPRRPAAGRRDAQRHRPQQGRPDRPRRRLGPQAPGARTGPAGPPHPRPPRRLLRLPGRAGAGPGGPRPVVRPRRGARLRLALLARRAARPPLRGDRPRPRRAAGPGRPPLPASPG